MKKKMKDSSAISDRFVSCFFSTNFNQLTMIEQKRLLIDKSIYTIDKYSSKITFTENRQTEKNTEKAILIGENFSHLGIEYCLSDLLLKDIFEYVKRDVYSSTEQLINIKVAEINLHAKHVETFGNLLEFLKEAYKVNYDEIAKSNIFLIYNEPEVWHYPDWEYYVTEEIRYNFDLIKMFLFDEFFYCESNIEIVASWENLHYHNEILNFIKGRINNLKNVVTVKVGNKKSTLSIKIFIEDGEEIFNYILKVYDDRLNPSFFSYLYDFLNTKLKKIRTKGSDSKKYRDYVEEVTKIKMSRIIYSDVNYSAEKSLMFDLFERYFSDYLDLKKMNNS